MSEETNYVTKEIFYEEIARAIENVREEIKALRQALAITSPRVIDTAEAEKRHCCPEWDFLEITKDDPEFEACLCFSQKPDAWIADVGEPPTEEEKQEPVAYMGTDIDGNPNKFRLNPFGGSIPLYTKTTGGEA